jgi:hypothetical protein
MNFLSRQSDFFNTTHEGGELLGRYQAKAADQELIILEFYQFVGLATPSEAHEQCFGDKTPITSTRRAISNLTKKGRLRKTPDKRIGPYGRPEYIWSVD